VAPGGGLVLVEALGVFIPRDLGAGCLAQHSEDQFEVGHVVAQVLALETLQFLVAGRRHAKRGFGNLGGEDGEPLLVRHTAFLPFAGEFIANGNSTDTLLDPIVGVSLIQIELPHPLLGEFGILDLLYPLIANLGQPALERSALGLGIDWMMRKAASVLTQSVL